jgi:hypothetical protein
MAHDHMWESAQKTSIACNTPPNQANQSEGKYA